MGKRGGGWGRGGGGEGEGRGGPRGVRPCPAQPGVQSRAQKDPTHGPEPCDWASPLAPRGHPVPTSPIPLTSCLSSLLPPRAWDSRALAPNRDWATEEPASHLGGGWPGPRGPSLQPTPLNELPAQPGPQGLGVWEEPPQGTPRVSRWGTGPRSGSQAPPLRSLSGTRAFLSGSASKLRARTRATAALRTHRNASPLFPKLEHGGDREKPPEWLSGDAPRGRTQRQATRGRGSHARPAQGVGPRRPHGTQLRRGQQACRSRGDRPQGRSPRSSVPPPPPPPPHALRRQLREWQRPAAVPAVP